MSNLLERGRSFLTRSMQRAGGVSSLTYSRGGLSVTLVGVAWVGNTLFRLETHGGGSRVEWGDRDYLIPAAALVLGGVVVEPAEFDRVAETVNGVACVFEVLPPDGEPAWRWSDTGRTVYRVHCKRVS